jgi:hypothetical protein
MYPERRLTAGERHFLVAFAGALPAIVIGFYVGVFAAGVGSQRELASIFIRALVCAAPPVLLAVLAPRSWFFPSLIYGCGFYCGYTCLDGSGAAFTFVVMAHIAALTGEHLGTPSRPTHPELLWLFIIALWLATFISFLRRYYARPNECAEPR